MEMKVRSKKLSILGIRGIPAAHGGFETFAERLAIHLSSHGWEVVVYCQEEADSTQTKIRESIWNGIRRVHIPVTGAASLGSVYFDLKAAWHARSQSGIFLTLGYNTAIFNILQRLSKQPNLINMDGIEWRRNKWSKKAKLWFWLNERAGCYVGNHLIADHPAIEDHLASRVRRQKITMIPYGGDEVVAGDEKLLSWSGLSAGNYSIIVARPEPENSFLEMVGAFSSKPRSHILVVLGKFEPEQNCYHRAVIDAASAEVIFLGAIYEARIIGALRYFARFYLHGHTVGGTNPSLVEAMGAGCAIIAHDNVFNRWVAGPGAEFFRSKEDCSRIFDALLQDGVKAEQMSIASRARFKERFEWARVLSEYEQLLTRWLKC